MNPSKVRDPRFWAKWQAAGAVGKVVAISSGGYERTTPWHEIVHDVIDEAVINWTQKPSETIDPEVKAVLLHYANAVAAKVLDGDTPAIDFSSEWKREVSNRVYALMDYGAFKNEQAPLIVAALKGRFPNVEHDLHHSLWGYSLVKIAYTVGAVVYMEKLGFPPEMLLMTPEEANASLLKMAERLNQHHPGKVLMLSLS